MHTYYKGYINTYTTKASESRQIVGKIFRDYQKFAWEKLGNSFPRPLKQKIKESLHYWGGMAVEFPREYVSSLDISKSVRKEILIIFEKIVSDDGNEFGKEILTGRYFPLPRELDYCHKCYISLASSESENFLLAEFFKYIYLNNLNFDFYMAEVDRAGAFIPQYEVADLNDIKKYKSKNSNNSFIKNVNTLANKNVFNREIIYKSKEAKEREKQDEDTIVMENIEYLLEKLGTVNKELKDKYQSEYDTLLNNGETKLTLTPINTVSLKNLEAKIEFALTFNKSNNYSLKDYLENLKHEYLNNFLNNNDKKTTLTIDDIDNLYEMFLKTRNEYSLKERRNTIKNISFIYLLEVYENINDIDIEKLSDSYFSDSIKTILLIIKSLIDTNVIENNIMLDLNRQYNLNETLKLIKEIKFINNNINGKKKILEKNKN